LGLFDENGHDVDRGGGFHIRPSLEVTPIRDATFSLQISMVGCRATGCAYGIGVFVDAR